MVAEEKGNGTKPLICLQKSERVANRGGALAKPGLHGARLSLPNPTPPSHNLAPHLKNRLYKARVAQDERLNQRREERELLEARVTIDRLERELGKARTGEVDSLRDMGPEKKLKEERKTVSWLVVLFPGENVGTSERSGGS